VHRLRRTSPVSNSTCRYSLDISLSSSLCLSLSAYADCPVEMGGSSSEVQRCDRFRGSLLPCEGSTLNASMRFGLNGFGFCSLVQTSAASSTHFQSRFIA